MMGSLLLRGMLAGLLAGLLAFGFARAFGEPEVARAIAFEAQASHAPAGRDHAGHDHAAPAAAEDEPELVSRETQAGLGLFTGIVVYGAALGGLFAIVFALVNGRLGGLDPRATAALLAAAGFVALVLAPALKYPANPPAIGRAETIGLRTALYFEMLVVSVAAVSLAIALARALAPRISAWNAALAGAAFFIASIAAVCLALPAVDEVPEHFSAALLWRFRLASLGTHAVLWTTIGLAFGALARGLDPSRRRRALAANAVGTLRAS